MTKKLRSNTLTEVGVETKKYVLDSSNVKNFFQIQHNRRDIRNAKVKKLLKILEDGKCFDTPFMCNLKRKIFRLLDGNHRYEAIKMYLEKNPGRKVQIQICYYENLTPEEEKIKYSIWNDVLRQTVNDFVKQYWDDMYIAGKFDVGRGLPCKVKPMWGKNAIEFKTLLAAYLTRKTVFNGGYSGSAIDFVDECKSLGDKSYNELKQFLTEFINVFGIPDRKNMHYKQSVFFALQRIWLDNYDSVNPDQMESALKRCFGHAVVVKYAPLGGTRANSIECRKELLSVINGNKKTNLFV